MNIYYVETSKIYTNTNTAIHNPRYTIRDTQSAIHMCYVFD